MSDNVSMSEPHITEPNLTSTDDISATKPNDEYITHVGSDINVTKDIPQVKLEDIMQTAPLQTNGMSLTAEKSGKLIKDDSSNEVCKTSDITDVVTSEIGDQSDQNYTGKAAKNEPAICESLCVENDQIIFTTKPAVAPKELVDASVKEIVNDTVPLDDIPAVQYDSLTEDDKLTSPSGKVMDGLVPMPPASPSSKIERVEASGDCNANSVPGQVSLKSLLESKSTVIATLDGEKSQGYSPKYEDISDVEDDQYALTDRLTVSTNALQWKLIEDECEGQMEASSYMYLSFPDQFELQDEDPDFRCYYYLDGEEDFNDDDQNYIKAISTNDQVYEAPAGDCPTFTSSSTPYYFQSSSQAVPGPSHSYTLQLHSGHQLQQCGGTFYDSEPHQHLNFCPSYSIPNCETVQHSVTKTLSPLSEIRRFMNPAPDLPDDFPYGNHHSCIPGIKFTSQPATSTPKVVQISPESVSSFFKSPKRNTEPYEPIIEDISPDIVRPTTSSEPSIEPCQEVIISQDTPCTETFPPREGGKAQVMVPMLDEKKDISIQTSFTSFIDEVGISLGADDSDGCDSLGWPENLVSTF